MPYLAITIYRQGLIAFFGKLKSGGSANDACPYYYDIYSLFHSSFLLSFPLTPNLFKHASPALWGHRARVQSPLLNV
jgi:hypothetical protein